MEEKVLHPRLDSDRESLRDFLVTREKIKILRTAKQNQLTYVKDQGQAKDRSKATFEARRM